jgi:CheY-like chemotaxis protein
VSLPEPPLFRSAISGRREILETIRQSDPEHIIPTSGTTLGNILLVEDNEVNQRLLSRLLSDGGFDVTLAENGAVALEILSEKTFDLILMDLQMPVMDGYEAIRYIKEDPNLSGIPIVALTAHAMKKDKKRALGAGCVGFLTKPIKKDALMAEIATHTGITPVENGPKTIHLDSMEAIYQDYVKGLPEELERITLATARRDFLTVRRIGHDLKGISGAFGQNAIGETGREIELAAKEERQELLQTLIMKLEREIEAVISGEGGPSTSNPQE